MRLRSLKRVKFQSRTPLTGCERGALGFKTEGKGTRYHVESLRRKRPEIKSYRRLPKSRRGARDTCSVHLWLTSHTPSGWGPAASAFACSCRGGLGGQRLGSRAGSGARELYLVGFAVSEMNLERTWPGAGRGVWEEPSCRCLRTRKAEPPGDGHPGQDQRGEGHEQQWMVWNMPPHSILTAGTGAHTNCSGLRATGRCGRRPRVGDLWRPVSRPELIWKEPRPRSACLPLCLARSEGQKTRGPTRAPYGTVTV